MITSTRVLSLVSSFCMESVAKGLVHVHATVIMVLAVGLNQWQPLNKSAERCPNPAPRRGQKHLAAAQAVAASQSHEQTKQATADRPIPLACPPRFACLCCLWLCFTHTHRRALPRI